ncbi:MAG: hypothetical protein ACTHMZ_04315 [Actinomycetes bacterium]
MSLIVCGLGLALPVGLGSGLALASPATTALSINYDHVAQHSLTCGSSLEAADTPMTSAADVVAPTTGSCDAPAGFVAAETAGAAADDWPVISGIVRDAGAGKGNFGLGTGTASQAARAGESWVGDGAAWSSDGKALISRDGLRQWRPPSYKPNLDPWQSNFESRLTPS